MLSLVFVLYVLAAGPVLSVLVEHVGISTDRVVETVDDMFVGVTIDTTQLHGHFALSHIRNPNLVKYAKSLTPGYVRVGGTEGDHILFGEHTGPDISLTHEMWDALNSFCQNSGLKLIFGFNDLARKDGKWDPTNARSLLNYSASKGYKIAGFELGNEPKRFYVHGRENVTFLQLGADFHTLHQVLQSTSYSKSLILGPDSVGYSDTHMKEFLSHSGNAVDVLTYHAYYFNGKTAKVADFHNARVLDTITKRIKAAVQSASSFTPPKPVWLGETSSAYGGGAANISNRYAAGFMWLDKLGLSSRHGLKGVMRQSLYGGHYGLLQSVSNMDPNPDYWLTVLYKKLVGHKVFDVPHTSSRNIRIYAHCTEHNNDFNYKPGSLTVYALNLNRDSIKLQFSSTHLDVFWLTPEHGDLQSQKIQLNGKTLEFTGDDLPTFTPDTRTDGQVTVAGLSFGYIVLVDANIASCKTDDHNTIIG